MNKLFVNSGSNTLLIVVEAILVGGVAFGLSVYVESSWESESLSSLVLSFFWPGIIFGGAIFGGGSLHSMNEIDAIGGIFVQVVFLYLVTRVILTKIVRFQRNKTNPIHESLDEVEASYTDDVMDVVDKNIPWRKGRR